MKISFITLILALFTLVLVSCRSTASHLSSTPIPSKQILPTSTMFVIPTFTPTIIPEKDVEFTLESANVIPPEDILKEISFFGGGGGFTCKPNQAPNIIQEPSNAELMTLSTMISCGWLNKEILKATVIYPAGGSVVSDLQTEDDGAGNYYGEFRFKTAIGDPPGKYTLILQGKNGTVQSDVYFSKPDVPRIVRPDYNHIYLYGFAPDELVKLFYYTETGKFGGWSEYTMNASGELLIKIAVGTDAYSTYFFAIGSKSGETRLFQENPFGETVDRTIQKSIRVSHCGSLQPRLAPGSTARVAFTDGKDMNIRVKPGIRQDIFYKVPEGTLLTLLDGPKCVGEMAWWRVRTDKKLEGWMAEYQDSVYLLEPIP